MCKRAGEDVLGRVHELIHAVGGDMGVGLSPPLVKGGRYYLCNRVYGAGEAKKEEREDKRRTERRTEREIERAEQNKRSKDRFRIYRELHILTCCNRFSDSVQMDAFILQL